MVINSNKISDVYIWMFLGIVFTLSIYGAINIGQDFREVTGNAVVKQQCNDGKDNDFDGYCDYITSKTKCPGNTIRGDPHCSSLTDNKESADCIPTSEVCDSLDNNCNSQIDEGLSIVCSSNPNCGSNYNSANFCGTDGNVYQTTTSYTCNNPGLCSSSCSNSASNVLVSTCQFGCSNSACNPDPCLNVNCPNTCSGSNLLTNGACVNGACIYSNQSCQYGCNNLQCNSPPTGFGFNVVTNPPGVNLKRSSWYTAETDFGFSPTLIPGIANQGNWIKYSKPGYHNLTTFSWYLENQLINENVNMVSDSVDLSLNGACVIRGVGVPNPQANDNDIGYGHVKRHILGVATNSGLQTACTPEIYGELMAQYCINTGKNLVDSSVQWGITTYGFNGVAQSSGCDETGCQTHPCVAPNTTVTSGACIVQSFTGTIPSGGTPDEGNAYVKIQPGPNTLTELRQVCPDSVFLNLMTSYCANTQYSSYSDQVKWMVVTYGADGAILSSGGQLLNSSGNGFQFCSGLSFAPVSGACAIKGSSSGYPNGYLPDIGTTYVKRHMSETYTYAETKSACTQQIYESMMTDYCSIPGAPTTFGWSVIDYSSTGGLGTVGSCANCTITTC